MSRFKVGDRVRVVRTQYPDNAPVGSLGTVTSAGNRGCDIRLGAGKSRVWFFDDDELAMDDATARLHAAAPDLLAVAECVDAMRWRGDETTRDWHERAIPALERQGFDMDGEPFSMAAAERFVETLAAAAIAKAKGGV